jgi:hypothetical protein
VLPFGISFQSDKHRVEYPRLKDNRIITQMINKIELIISIQKMMEVCLSQLCFGFRRDINFLDYKEVYTLIDMK